MKEPPKSFYHPQLGKIWGLPSFCQLLALTSEYLGIIPQLPIKLGMETFLVNIIMLQGPLDLNMVLGHDYVYVINFLVSTLFWVMHFPHNGIIVTIDQLAYDNHHPHLTLS
jgi:hypothetical protein